MPIKSLIRETIPLQSFRIDSIDKFSFGISIKIIPDYRFNPLCGKCGKPEGTYATFEVKDLDFPLLNTIDINTSFCFFLKKECYGVNKNLCAIDIIKRLSGCYRKIIIW